jgi:hypothetical protein
VVRTLITPRCDHEELDLFICSRVERQRFRDAVGTRMGWETGDTPDESNDTEE